MGVQLHNPIVLPPGKTWYLLYRMLGGPQGRCEKCRPPTGFDPRIVHPVASRYTDRAIPALQTTVSSNSPLSSSVFFPSIRHNSLHFCLMTRTDTRPVITQSPAIPITQTRGYSPPTCQPIRRASLCSPQPPLITKFRKPAL
jgi:hypothetical protein